MSHVCQFRSRLNVPEKHTSPAKHLLQRDLARAQIRLTGQHPTGPSLAAHEARKSHRHHPHSTPAGSGGATDPAPPTSGGGASIDVTNAAVTYVANVKIGDEQNGLDYSLLIDTGSSNTFCGSKQEYKQTSTSTNTRNAVSVSYGSGSFTGTEYTDRVELSPSMVVQKQSIGVTTPQKAKGFTDVDGILGIGPVDLTQGTVKSTTTVPTVLDSLKTQGTISVESIGIFYEPTTSADNVANGEMTFGEVDSSKITQDVQYVPITKTSPASHYWGIDQSMTYGGKEIMGAGTAGIVDTGTTLLLLATDIFNKYKAATGATEDSTTGLLTVTAAQFAKMQDLVFNVGDAQYSLTPNAQIWPRALNTTLGGDPNKIYLVTADMGSPSGQGLDFIDGFCFLQRFYSVYDTTNKRVGFAPTQFTDATTN